MKPINTVPSELEVLACYGAADGRLFTVGTYDVGITVHSQQVRALNLAWALVESGTLTTENEVDKSDSSKKQRLAIVGGGFAGLTLAAALIKKGFSGHIALFERRDALLPLQQGSDARWLHPRIYEWPAKGSEVTSAALPVLNWTAGRASDVAVQVLNEWRQIVDSAPGRIDIYCNAHHLQVHGGEHGKPLRIEWVADKQGARSKSRGRLTDSISIGSSGTFDHVVLSVGFGLEKEKAWSYWRNETLAQPQLGKGRFTYIVSGQGDGALIDLLRLRISMFRQDRILSELFADLSELVRRFEEIRDLAAKSENNPSKIQFDLFESLENIDEIDLRKITLRLKARLRRDTQVILHVKTKRFRDLFDIRASHISFQNRLLVYFLYKCGGFIPASQDIEILQEEYGVPDERVVKRHGTLRDELFSGILDPLLLQRLERERGEASNSFRQTSAPVWTGGYFAFRGKSADASAAPDQVKQSWRKEYLPAATQLVASSFCSAVAAYLSNGHQPIAELRVTLHRVLVIGTDVVLQQCCDYVGTASVERMISTARRTFPAENGTIGIAHSTGRIVVSNPSANYKALKKVMASRNLNEASRAMSSKVQSLLAIPMIINDPETLPVGTNYVLSILYADSYGKHAFNVDVVDVVAKMCQGFLEEMRKLSSTRLDRMSNYVIGALPALIMQQGSEINDEFYLMDLIKTPSIEALPALNFDHTDFLFS